MPTIQGRLLFADDGSPIIHLELRVRDATGELGRGETDAEGRFVISVPTVPSAYVLAAIASRRRYDATGTARDELSDAFTRRIDDGTTELGELRIRFWNYRADRPVARAADGAFDPPRTDQGHAPGYLEVLGRSVATVKGYAAGVGAALAREAPVGLDDVQSAFPEAFTQRIDRFLSHTRSDAWLGEIALNGFHTAPLGRDAACPELVRIGYEWGDDVPCDGRHDVSDVQASFSVHPDGLRPVSIDYVVRTPHDDGSGTPRWSVAHRGRSTPDDANWSSAKRIFRSNWLLSGALDAHIIRTHLFVEQVCIAAHRTLRRNPLRHLLFPHLEEVVAADTDADAFAWGPKGQIPTGSTLSFEYVERRMARELGGMDWRNFRPRRPLASTHKYALVQRLYFDLVDGYVRDFVTHAADEIAAEWLELRRFSDTLVAHSPAFVAPTAPFGVDWSDEPEIVREHGERVVVGGVLRAVTPIVRGERPAPEDWDRVVEFCRYVIHLGTFVHSWVHDGQYDAGGEIRYASLALRNGSFGDEHDDALAPPPNEALTALVTNNNGILTNFGFLVADEEGDVPPEFKKRLLARADDFARLGFDVRRIRSRINI